MAEQLAEVEVIAGNPEPPTFENTLAAYDRSGRLLDRADSVFGAMASAHTNDTIKEVQSWYSPAKAAHLDTIRLHAGLFRRIQALYVQRLELDLDPESIRLVEQTYIKHVRAGVLLAEEAQARLKEINAEIASLKTEFTQNLTNEVNAKAIVVDEIGELAGLSENQVAATAEAARARGLDGKYVLPLLNTSGQPALSSLENRELRERIHRTSLSRGSSGDDYDNRSIVVRTMRLRAERAQLLGYPNHATYIVEDRVARTTDAVNQLLSSMAAPAMVNARSEAEALQAVIEAEGGDFELASWDWDFYSEKIKQQRYAFDEAELKPYFEMNNVLVNGVFFAANRLYGLTFKPRPDLPVYHEDVKAWEVFDADGSTLGLFVQDFYARESKRGGAWMNHYVHQSRLLGTRAVVANHLNVPRPPEGQPTLLTWAEVTTMFHEFGHAVHGLFSNVRYRAFSGTTVPRDFVEFPSQVNEMWAEWPEVLTHYAVHYETGQPMPAELLEKKLSSGKFNQGFSYVERLASMLLDQDWHQRKPGELPDADGLLAFEAASLEHAGVAFGPIPPRYRSTYFNHIMTSYDAAYYSYVWSEVMDADTVEWFKEHGGMLRANGNHFRTTLLSRGFSQDPLQQFINFRGREPDVRPLLLRRGLTSE